MSCGDCIRARHESYIRAVRFATSMLKKLPDAFGLRAQSSQELREMNVQVIPCLLAREAHAAMRYCNIAPLRSYTGMKDSYVRNEFVGYELGRDGAFHLCCKSCID